MRPILLAAACLGPVAAAGAGVPVASVAIADVVQRVSPGVVRIVVVHPPAKAAAPATATAARVTPVPMTAADTGFNKAKAADQGTVTKIGSGFVVDNSGLIATNRHVIEDSVSIFVGSADGSRFRATVVGVAKKSDIALLRIDPSAHLPALSFGDSDALRPGDTVIAIGSPFGFDNTVTAGVVSSINRDIMESPFDAYIQTDAAINHGNSGGPLFNTAGEVVGMNSVLFAPGEGSAGVGFAIPANEVRFVLDRLVRYGDVRAGMLPIRTQQVTGLMAAAIGVPSAGGALIASLMPGAGPMNGLIQPGDVITRMNDEAVADPRDLARKAAQLAAGDTVSLQLHRAGQVITVHVPILPLEGSVPVAGANAYHPKVLGLSFVSGTGASKGVMVADLDMAGSAADSGLQKGDVILRVQQQTVATPGQALQALQLRIEAKQAYAALLVQRDDKQMWMPVALPD